MILNTSLQCYYFTISATVRECESMSACS